MHMCVNFHCIESRVKISHHDLGSMSGRAFTCVTIEDDDGNNVNILLPRGARIALTMPDATAAETITDEAKG